MIVMCNEPKSGIVKFFHVSGRLTQTVPCFERKCLRQIAKEEKQSMSCLVVSYTPAFEIFEDANIMVAILQEKAVRKPKEKNVSTT